MLPARRQSARRETFPPAPFQPHRRCYTSTVLASFFSAVPDAHMFVGHPERELVKAAAQPSRLELELLSQTKKTLYIYGLKKLYSTKVVRHLNPHPSCSETSSLCTQHRSCCGLPHDLFAVQYGTRSKSSLQPKLSNLTQRETCESSGTHGCYWHLCQGRAGLFR